ncbi:DUF2381 family protein [Archangium sp.]|uniref:DUF2381 family protein n=1 Tax=Archangium sp. TaxID=1872627 RepID=UPI002D2208E9|nr:DUF2381 family protein [Archangium sp.]HYO53449.1 DUF2381 family protein [Archangium sp.]
MGSGVLLLSLHTGVPALAQPPPEPWEPGVRHLELSASAAAGKVPELPITPGLALTFIFDTPVRQGGVELEESEHFLWGMDTRGQFLTLVLSREVKPGRRLKLRVHFADGGVPASAEFVLVSHPAPAETHVQVYRQPRSAEACCQEAKAEWEKRQQCQVELARTRTECNGPGPRGLIGLRADGLMGEEAEGVRAQHILEKLTRSPANPLTLRDAITLRTAAPEQERKKRVRVAVLLQLENPGAQGWKVEGAQLAARGGVRPNVTVWQSAPIEPEGWEVMVETELTEEEAQGRFTLKLWNTDGTRTFSVGNVTFP